MQNDRLEAALEQELAQIEAKIVGLEAEKAAIVRMIARVRFGDTGKEAAPARSANRVVIEGAIINVLATAARPLNARQVFERVRIVHRTLKFATLRSHLNRMEARGRLARPADSRGLWTIPSSKQET